MENKIEFNWILKLNEEQIPLTLKEGNLEKFAKKEIREYPMGKNIFLVNQDWTPIAYVRIEKLNKNWVRGYTSGDYRVQRMFNNQEVNNLKEILIEMYKEK